ncbi:TPA: flagellar motor switch protein FliN [Candidatus Galligastranaerophilus intestinavium]|uniref:Flagellar motor switch protein FliN n=1 Tax=Candidatus Galligastranaerophilus intestinavium TaxID=2840836 RepID=A0A9D1FIN8_9BACT|nr:flagellar motor switch protein FliN [Candidatus Galligastranaerophilus intestinavium]
MSDKEPKDLDLSKFENVERPVETKQDETSSNTLGLLMDVELELSAILGSCDMSVKKILELTKGSIIELENKTAEPIDLLVNGKLIGKGEVVIIEDNFGLRITDTIEEGKKIHE